MQRKKLNINAETAREILYGGSDDYEIVSDKITDTSRWRVNHYIVIKDIKSGEFYADGYSRGATEYQDESPWEYDEPNFTQVFPVEKTVIIYE